MRVATIAFSMMLLSACGRADDAVEPPAPVPGFTIARGKEHYAFSRAIPPVLRVPDGAVVEVHTKEASNNLVTPGMTSEAYRKLVWPEPYGHPLAGPVYPKSLFEGGR